MGGMIWLLVALLLLICIAAATIHKKEVVTDDYETSGLTITTGCIMFAASLLLIIELIMLLLRFLNPSHFNNNYTAYCRWGIAKCIMAVIGLFIMCFFEISFTRDELIESDCYTKRVEDRAKCKHGMKVYELALATTIITVICISLLLVLFVWDVIFLTYNFKSRIPVPRDYELIQQ
ncbi:uncharacterized protein [Dysidea avara]|uniref:uncharacterized protein isoform X2 n=1 Tax=Dysidea avara TaxID=196820 RepID=UPI00331FE4D5